VEPGVGLPVPVPEYETDGVVDGSAPSDSVAVGEGVLVSEAV
jgi:hypothetical protein